VEATACRVPSLSAASRLNRLSCQCPGRPSEAPSNSKAQNSDCELASMSSTEENCTKLRGYRGQKVKHFPPSTTARPRPRATAAMPSSKVMGDTGYELCERTTPEKSGSKRWLCCVPTTCCR